MSVTIRSYRFPSIVSIAMEVAPLVRLGVLTDAEGRNLVSHRYVCACARFALVQS